MGLGVSGGGGDGARPERLYGGGFKAASLVSDGNEFVVSQAVSETSFY